MQPPHRPGPVSLIDDPRSAALRQKNANRQCPAAVLFHDLRAQQPGGVGELTIEERREAVKG